ncbi:DUF305 domain-containing protein [Candidatus Saccharibacteria bacterium]|nr:DUF305 domain-containing protein [Candidatus Saccharibacteria bacterium]MCA9336671.1 DUF305 domain-containing protein [Candidatus Saccharibacteria bacterium]
MKITKNKVFAVVIIVLVAFAAAIWYFGVFSIKPEKTSDAQDMKTTQQTINDEKTTDSKYATLYGDEFDEAFIADMLAHHDGALNMAEQAGAVTAHEEIRTLSTNIIQTQGQEVMKMREWQKEWGYKETMSGGHMSHSGAGMDMGGDMVEMMNKLKDLKGEEYDKEFLKQMILHHEQAIEMSRYAETNANHQELKDLAREVIAAQTKEIEQMKQWQQEWGY